jgi:magnesium transporter
MPGRNSPKNTYLKPDVAGFIMLPLDRVPIAKTTDRISEIENNLLKKIKDMDTINYIYIVDDQQKLKGVISIKDIFLRPKETLVSEIMEKKMVKARLRTDQERVALSAIKCNLKAVPVVDKHDKLLGIVSSDTILDILYKEATEDIFYLAGVRKFDETFIDVTKSPAKAIIFARFPWLLVGLAGGIIAARILGFFETTLETQIIFAFFIPVMLYMANAVAIQSQTIFIRSLTINPKLEAKVYLPKEIKVGGLIALICAALLTLFSFLWQASALLGVILGISMFFSITWAVLLSIFVPWLLRKLRKDPALGSGPLGTILNDVSTLVIYFSVVSLMIEFFAL